MNQEPVTQFLNIFLQSIQNQTFVKLILSKPTNKTDLKNIFVRLIEVKKEQKLSFTYRYATRDEVKNYDFTDLSRENREGGVLVENFIGNLFLNAVCFTIEQEITLSFNKKGENPQISSKKLSNSLQETPISTAHNKEKKRLLDATKPYFHALEITDANGNVTPTGQKKI